MTIGANELERMAEARPNEYFLKGSGVIKLIGAIRTLEAELAALKAQPAPTEATQVSANVSAMSMQPLCNLAAQRESSSQWSIWGQTDHELSSADYQLVFAEIDRRMLAAQGEDSNQSDAARYKSLFDIDDFWKYACLKPVIDWLRDWPVSKNDVDRALDEYLENHAAPQPQEKP